MGAIPPINASLAASGALNSAYNLDTQTSINFGSGYINNPNSQTPQQSANPVATSALGNAGGSAPSSTLTPTGFSSFSHQDIEIAIVAVGAVLALGAIIYFRT